MGHRDVPPPRLQTFLGTLPVAVKTARITARARRGGPSHADHRSRRERDGALTPHVPFCSRASAAQKADVLALEEVILRVSALVDNHPAIAEMDCNPVMVRPRGAVVVDARVRVQEVSRSKPLAAPAAAG